MYKSLLSVGGLTILSRGTGFLRDVALSAILGAGGVADAFVVAFRLPNHFRAIFGEGAFNSAYVPSYSRVLETQGPERAKTFASQIFTILLASQIVLLVLAMAFTPELVRLLAPGFESDPTKMDHAISMTRITFPYLLCVTLVTLQSGTLNANRRFTAAAFAPVLLNVVMVMFLGVAFLFPNAGIAASVGVTVSGVLQLVMMLVAARRAGLMEKLVRPRWSTDVRRFFRALGPAVIGSAGVQIAIFADTIISSMLPTGGPSSIYYAERIYQLPIGVIGIAAGTVLLPEMSRRLAQGDAGAALHAQNRTMALTLALSAPFFLMFMLMPREIMQGVFQRGQFTSADAAASAAVLAAYGIGLLPIVLIRSAVASFQARGDTTTPMIASLAAVAFNLALKLLLYKPLGAVGLATATAVGAWINLLILVTLASLKGTMRLDETLARVAVAVDVGCLALGAFIVLAAPSIEDYARHLTTRGELSLLLIGMPAAALYGVTLLGALWLLQVKLPGLPRRFVKARA
ncbi:murein biosynthesis integral membrane protein MurJ [Lichenihabitans sp. PAMC28606]|uniref:murein biosynthesis integral membrane protein MurJ n=1 Tax=Lichenihabitans sp. PAMC28606 TaxID=2880932 RepID=UPI001D0AD093|nr:murein biosynthesis integral membrane protein MurJ [Lichenihabitans sp. PAMC28606]UDL94854.1 murein biosynthesis integral membrane protein MurJ [Lichenihabitans sp. PAMC28606]